MAIKKFELTGFDKLAEQLMVLATFYKPEEVIKKGTINSVRKALRPIHARVEANAPYDSLHNTSGIHLRETVRTQVRLPNEKDKKSQFYHPSDFVWGMVSVKKSAVSLSQEFGNARTKAQPYLRVSFESGAEESLKILKEQLQLQLKQYMKNVVPML